MEDQNVWVLYLNHKHGNEVSAYDSKEKAKKALVEYCLEWWHDNIAGSIEEMTDDQIIENYFEYNYEEVYEISECAIQ